MEGLACRGAGDLLVGADQENPGDSPTAAGRAYLFSGDPKATAMEGGEPPPGFALEPPRPNPSRGRVALALAVPEAGAVRVAFYDLLGREVAVVVDRPLAAGRHELAFDGSALPAWVYVVRAITARGQAAVPLTLVR